MFSKIICSLLLGYFCNTECFKLPRPDNILDAQNTTEELRKEMDYFSKMPLEDLLKIIDPIINDPENLEGGDILDDSRSRKATTSTLYWPSGIVRYAIGTGITSATKELIKNVRDAIQTNTCIRLVDVSSAPSGNYINFYKGSGCGSSVGMIGGAQQISIGTNCDKFGKVAHEIFHALGLYHEHARSDRNSYVHILAGNVKSGKMGNFNKASTANYGVPYDYMSVMHYASNGFTTDFFGKNTIATKDVAYTYRIGQREKPSFSDYKILNLMYNCNARCASKNCGNKGGYVGPSCQCVCPTEYTGNSCQILKPSSNFKCGRRISATAVGQTFEISTPGYPTRQGNEYCAWDISSPPGTKVQINFKDFSFIERYTGNTSPVYYNKCIFEFVELRTTNLYSGPFYCGTDLKGQVITSSINRLMAMIKPSTTRGGTTGMKAIVTIVR